MAKLVQTLIGVLVLALCACSSPRFQQDRKPGTDFHQLRTYAWRSARVEIPGANTVYLQGLVDEQLRLKGYHLVQDKPDLLLDLSGFTRLTQGGNTGIGIGLALPIGPHGSISLGGSKVLGNGNQEAVLVLDATRRLDNSLIWRGNAQGLSPNYFKLNAQSKLQAYIQGLVAPFPYHD